MKHVLISIIILFITIMFIAPSSASVIVQGHYEISTGESVSPIVLYNNTYNNTFFKTTLNKGDTVANSNITSEWADTSYSDNTCTMFANTLGEIEVHDYSNDSSYIIPSPYKTITENYGVITGIAATSDYDCTGNSLIVEMTSEGYLFHYYDNAWGIFNSTGPILKLPPPGPTGPSPPSGPSGPGPGPSGPPAPTAAIIKLPGNNWTSLTTNTYVTKTECACCAYTDGAYSTYTPPDIYFVATNLNGTVWEWNTDTGNYGLINSKTAPQEIISTAMYYNATYIYGLSNKGNIYRLNTEVSNAGWEKINKNTLPKGTVSIALSGAPYCYCPCVVSYYEPYMYALNIDNGTTLYHSQTTICGKDSIDFVKSKGIIDHNQTNEALTIYCGDETTYPEFYVLQTNGTILNYNSNTRDTKSFTWSAYKTTPFGPAQYSTLLEIKDKDKSESFNAALLYIASTNISNLNYFLINFNNTTLYREFLYDSNGIKNYGSGVTITSSQPVTINVTILSNSAYNSYLKFNVVYYTGGVYVFYTFNITIINHFNYWTFAKTN